ncbi:hypothetical protein NEOLI_004319 [Neolecta irregularis DAH-3]|uniref:Uncharacterized protein n=1 Tax=Neolecta irregularis (strain DAH-3) TaxID=1198029 RepID=A0A1U7LQ67_NEOID|nr:hypothetical protein NEOLI_004319 [Neolecta irregularis DAH-3]|eukprot:OLL24768.1 hypothetical protein NEOLI_004319 [Neolecta irregularis DAH-3]
MLSIILYIALCGKLSFAALSDKLLDDKFVEVETPRTPIDPEYLHPSQIIRCESATQLVQTSDVGFDVVATDYHTNFIISSVDDQCALACFKNPSDSRKMPRPTFCYLFDEGSQVQLVHGNDILMGFYRSRNIRTQRKFSNTLSDLDVITFEDVIQQ